MAGGSSLASVQSIKKIFKNNLKIPSFTQKFQSHTLKRQEFNTLLY